MNNKYLHMLAEEEYRKRYLFDTSNNSFIFVGDVAESKYMVFDTESKYRISSSFYFEKNLAVINNIVSEVKGKGYARLMVEATESLMQKTGIHSIFITHNINPSFWEHFAYSLVDKVDFPILNGIKISTPNNLMLKNNYNNKR